MKKMRYGMLLSILVAGALAIPAKATIISFDLTVDNCTGGCQPGNPGDSMGTVTLNDFGGTGDVRFIVTLVSPLLFINTGLHETFDFNIIGTPTISVTGVSPTSFSLDSTTASTEHFDGFGTFEYAMKLNTGPGAGGATAGPLTFDVISSGLTVASFLTNGTGASAFFAADVYNTANGNTGPIGGGTGAHTVPEPTSILLLGTVLACAGGLLRRRLVS